MSEHRIIREGALQPVKNPSATPPGPMGAQPINPITGRPLSPSGSAGSGSVARQHG